MSYQIRIQKGDFWKKEEISHYNLFTRICKLIADNENFRVYTIVGQKYYPSLQYRYRELSMKNLDNENEQFFESIED